MRPRVLDQMVQLAVSLAIIAAITFLFLRLIEVNETTVALTFLLAILAVSAVWGLAVAVAMSLAAVIAFNFYFIPPVGSFTVADPKNWVALGAFMITAVLGSQLSSR
ncbi:MAG TPA: DUF4118 domain-containing protein, partial [Candidatus Solibacter sp.]|nr:DUF4118 domain-containing protein [Candidatus Solibacter sp.]